MSYVPNGAAANEAAKVKVLSVNHNKYCAYSPLHGYYFCGFLLTTDWYEDSQ